MAYLVDGWAQVVGTPGARRGAGGAEGGVAGGRVGIGGGCPMGGCFTAGGSAGGRAGALGAGGGGAFGPEPPAGVIAGAAPAGGAVLTGPPPPGRAPGTMSVVSVLCGSGGADGPLDGLELVPGNALLTIAFGFTSSASSVNVGLNGRPK